MICYVNPVLLFNDDHLAYKYDILKSALQARTVKTVRHRPIVIADHIALFNCRFQGGKPHRLTACGHLDLAVVAGCNYVDDLALIRQLDICRDGICLNLRGGWGLVREGGKNNQCE